MNKAELNILAQKYLAGTATPDEKRLLDEWYKQVHSEETELGNLNHQETEADVKQRIFTNLNQKLFVQPNSVNKPGASIKRMLVWASSAAAVLALTFCAWIFYNKNNTDALLADRQIVNVPCNCVMHLTLPDSSKVRLNATNGRKKFRPFFMF